MPALVVSEKKVLYEYDVYSGASEQVRQVRHLSHQISEAD